MKLYVILKSDTQFILFDEPFTHISPVHNDIIENIILSESGNKGLLIADHLYRHILYLLLSWQWMTNIPLYAMNAI